MLKASFAICLYLLALLCVWTAFQTAPDMVWPSTPIGGLAALLLVAGIIFKGMGHFVLLKDLH